MTTTRTRDRTTRRPAHRSDEPATTPAVTTRTHARTERAPTTPPPLPASDGSTTAFVETARERERQPRPATPHHPSRAAAHLDANPQTADPVRAQADEVRALYAPSHSAVPRGAQRVLCWVGELQAAIARASAQPDRVAGLMHRDVRTAAFMLEATLRLYREAHGVPFDDARKTLKELEDQIGALGHAQDMRRAGQGCADLPAPARAYLEQQVVKQRDRLSALVDPRWLPDPCGQIPALAGVVDTVLAADWKTGDADRATIRQALCRQLDEVAAGGLDMSQLQDGLHELRRQLRWVPIYGMAMKGAVVLDDALVPEPRYAALRDAPVASSPFATLPSSPQDREPLRLSRTVFLRCTQLVEELGGLKDRGEAIEGLAKALRKADLVEDEEASMREAARLLGLDPHTVSQIQATSATLYPEARRVCNLFAEGLRAQG